MLLKSDHDWLQQPRYQVEQMWYDLYKHERMATPCDPYQTCLTLQEQMLVALFQVALHWPKTILDAMTRVNAMPKLELPKELLTRHLAVAMQGLLTVSDDLRFLDPLSDIDDATWNRVMGHETWPGLAAHGALRAITADHGISATAEPLGPVTRATTHR